MKRQLTAVTSAVVPMTAVLCAQSAQVEELGSSTIVGSKQTNQVNNIELAKEKVSLTAGGGSVIDSASWTGRVAKPEEIFQLDPGVYARSNGVANDTRISVRGSGIQRRFGSRGVSLLLDGVPLNSADGSFDLRVIDPLSIDYIETFRGGNGLRHGANQLGGAIQIYQKTGANSPGGQTIVEAGSFETYRVRTEYGAQQGKWDYFLGYTFSETDGFRDRQNSETNHFNFNLGYQWSDTAQTRFHFLFNDSDALLSGSLTEEEFNDDPRQSEPGRDVNTDRDLATFHIGQVTKWGDESSEWRFFTNYLYQDLDHLTGFGLFTFNNLVDFDTDEFSTGLAGHHDYKIGNLNNRLYVSASAEYGRNEVGGFSQFITSPTQTPNVNDREDTSTNLKLYLENDSIVNDKHHWIAGLGYIWTERRRNIGSLDQNSSPFNSSQEGFVWKAGYLYEHSDNTQFYANVSQSFEAAPFSEADEPGVSNPQEAITYEVGTRFQNDWLKGEFTVFFANVNEEFIFEELVAGSGLFDVTNADTTHFGIEAAADIDLNRAFNFDSSVQFDLGLSYQLNDFQFTEGELDGNQIPVVSENVIVSKLSASTDKWKASASVDWLPSGLFADNLNTLETDGYAIVDLDLEYQLNSKVSLYGGVSNVFDEDFVSTVTVNPDSDRFRNPGDGRAAYLGVKVKW